MSHTHTHAHSLTQTTPILMMISDGADAQHAELLVGSANLDVPAAPSSLKGAIACALWPLHSAYGRILLAEAKLQLQHSEPPTGGPRE
jgi:hypothetical protein